MRGWGLTRGKEAALDNRDGTRPLFHRRGDGTRDLLGGGQLANCLLVLAARVGARGCSSIGEGGGIVGMKVAGRKGGNIIRASLIFPGFAAVGVQPGVLLGVTECLAKLGIVEWYELFGVLICVGYCCGTCLGPFLPLP